jgi:hypothetical protein
MELLELKLRMKRLLGYVVSIVSYINIGSRIMITEPEKELNRNLDK